MRHFATHRACVTTTDPFSIMEKSDESQFFENMTIYLKTKKMSQWIKQMRWRIKKSLPSLVSNVDAGALLGFKEKGGLAPRGVACLRAAIFFFKAHLGPRISIVSDSSYIGFIQRSGICLGVLFS